jgi:hypothetical protein
MLQPFQFSPNLQISAPIGQHLSVVPGHDYRRFRDELDTHARPVLSCSFRAHLRPTSGGKEGAMSTTRSNFLTTADEMMKINLTPDQLDLLINELGQFGDSVAREMKALRRNASESQVAS